MNILITGGSRGIGEAIARRFAKEGHALILTAKNEERLKLLAEELNNTYNTVVYYKSCDHSNKEAVKELAFWLNKQVDNLDILVNNAGSFMPGNVTSEPDGTLEQMISVNLYSAYYTTRALLRAMKKSANPHIFNMCSIAGLQAYDNGGSYSISKFALMGFTKNLRKELMAERIKVTGIYPGAVYTDSWSGSGVSKQRIMEVNDIADLVYTAAHLSPQACPEEIVIRPLEGDL